VSLRSLWSGESVKARGASPRYLRGSGEVIVQQYPAKLYDSESDLENSTAAPNIPTCVKSKYSALQQTRESGSSLITPMSVPFCMKSCLVPFCVVFLLSKLHIQSCHLLCFSYTREDPDDLQMLLLITSQGQRGFRFWLFCAFVGRRGADDAC